MNTSDALVEGDRTRLCPIMMIQMIVEEGEEQMYISMGKRMSNCEPDAPMPQNTMDGSMMPMMMNSNIIGGGSITMMGMTNFYDFVWGSCSFEYCRLSKVATKFKPARK